MGKGGGGTGLGGDYVQLEEGLSDCFAMLFTHDQLGSISSPNPSPFHIGSGAIIDPFQADKGAPNLVNPADSGKYEYHTWAADREAPCTAGLCTTVKDHHYSTLVSGACKLLVTGAINGSDVATKGTNPDPTFASIAVVPHLRGLPESISLGANGYPANTVDEAEAFDRLEEVLLEAVTNRLSSNAGFFDVIDAMALSADHLGKTSWASTGDKTRAYGERVRRAFSVYGFGRAVETEPNDALAIGKLTGPSKDGTEAAANLIAANHTGWSRAIHGEVGLNPKGQTPIAGCSGQCNNSTECDLDQDFFVLNELVRPGDIINFSIKNAKKPDLPPQFRVRVFHTEPCQGFTDEKKGPKVPSPLNTCQNEFQVYPEPTDLSDTSDTPAPKEGSAQIPGAGSVGRVVYIGVMPVSQVPCGAYELKVTLSRKNPRPYR